MSISTTSTKDSYAGNASITTQYPITFKYLEESHVSVYIDGVLQTKGAGADYVMGGDGTTNTGYITTNVAQADTKTITIVLDVPFDQPVDLQETGVLSSSTLEEAYDRLNMQIRRVWRKVGDALMFSSDEDGSSTGTADTLIGFDNAGDIEEVAKSTFVESSGGINNISDVTTTSPSDGQVLVWNGSVWENSSASSGDGDMLASAYDPNTVGGDAFDMDNMVEGANTKILTSAERTAISTNTSDISSLTGADIAYTPAGTVAVASTIQAKVREHITPADFGAVGNGTTDDTSAIQAAIDHAESLCDAISVEGDVVAGGVVVDLAGKLYAITDTLTVDKNIKLQNGSLVATQAMTGTTASSTFMLKIRSGAKRMCVDGVDFDGGLSGTTKYADLIEVNAERVSLSNIMGIHFPSYGIRYIEGQESRTTNVTLREWLYSEAGTTDDTLRTAKAFSVEDADMMLTNCTGAQSLYPFYVSGSLNQFVGCHAYNGGDLTPSVEAHSVYIDNADNNVFTGCYFDNGNVYIKTSFNHTITGCHFQKNANGSNDSGIFIDTATTGENVAGLNVVGCMFNGTFASDVIEFGTSASGTYVHDIFLKLMWVGNYKSNGNPAWKDAKIGVNSYHEFGASYYNASVANGDSYNLNSTKNLRLSADHYNDSGGANSKVILATDGTDRYEVGSSGELLPLVDNGQVLGNSSYRFNNVFSNRMTLMDGVTAPSAVSGHAQLYIDTADGDLKVIFGDGTVKTITVDS